MADSADMHHVIKYNSLYTVLRSLSKKMAGGLYHNLRLFMQKDGRTDGDLWPFYKNDVYAS